MKNRYRFIGLCGCIVFIGAGPTASGNSQPMPDNPADNRSGAPKLVHPFPAPEKNAGFTMKIIKPKPDVKYHIGHVTPDPDIDYKIRIVGPARRDDD